MKVVYCAYGARKYADQVAQSVRSLRAAHPGAVIEVHTTADFAPYLVGLPVNKTDLHRPDMMQRQTFGDPCRALILVKGASVSKTASACLASMRHDRISRLRSGGIIASKIPIILARWCLVRSEALPSNIH